MSHPTLLIIQGSDQGARFELSSDESGLGRGNQNAIRLHDTEASRSHAHIVVENGQYILTDLKSANGTYVNGRPVKSCQLSSGDQIQIGRTLLLFSLPVSARDSNAFIDRVALVDRHGPDDHSHIVESTGPEELSDFVGKDIGKFTSQTLANLQVLYRIAEEAVRPSLSFEQLLGRILELTLDVSGAHRGCMLIKDPETGELVPRAVRFRRGVDSTQRIPVSSTIVEWVLQNRQGVRTSDARSDARFVPGQSILQGGIREAICVPLQGRSELLGVAYIDITTPPEKVLAQTEGTRSGQFTEDLLRLTVAIGRQSALAVEEHRYEQAYVKAERLAAMGHTITILSHHIKNILQGIRGGSYLIDMGLRDHSEDLIRKGWGIVEKNQGKIYHLVMDMLTFSKERQPAARMGNLNELAQEVCDLLQTRAGEIGVKLVFQPDTQLPPCSFDPEGLHRALMNIVINALDAVEEKPDGQVLVTTGHDAGVKTVYVVVADNGPGIAPERLSQIYNLFESTKGARGTGIGLAVSQKIVREHGGDIAVQSEVGKGSQFTLEWPIIEEPAGGES